MATFNGRLAAIKSMICGLVWEVLATGLSQGALDRVCQLEFMIRCLTVQSEQITLNTIVYILIVRRNHVMRNVERFKGPPQATSQRERNQAIVCYLNHIPTRHAPRGIYRQRIRACHPKQVLADKSGRQHFGNSHDILARYACTDPQQTARKSSARLARDRTSGLYHCSPHLNRPRHGISKRKPFFSIFITHS